MKTSQIQEALLFLLIIWFFYQGTIKMAHWNEYIGWVGQIRLFRQTYILVGYIVPVIETGLSLLLLIPRYRRKSLTALIIGELLYLALVIWGLASSHLQIDPVPEIFGRPSWIVKLLIVIATLVISFYLTIPKVQASKKISI